jgi:AraC family transcriptional regulator, regulatory protein of adaptative response / methylated-DNA-[protein]-cysteine methyltransferase
MDTMRTDEYKGSEQRWQAVLDNDPRADGKFFYGVVSTGIYCRPTCASRPPHRKNIRYFNSAEEAEDAGMRPCLRCRPDVPIEVDENTLLVTAACRHLEEAETAPSLDDLSAAANLSRYHFQRVFKEVTGVTPLQYYKQKRAERLRDQLKTSPTVTGAIYESGFGSSSSFYAQAEDSLGMNPSDYRGGGEGLNIRFATAPTDLGYVLVAASERGICAVTLGDDPAQLEEFLRERFPLARCEQDEAEFLAQVSQVAAFVQTPRRGLNLPLDIQGTAFQMRVWQALQEIPPGETQTYAEVAKRIGQPAAVRAVAGACASNRIAVIIPCHRVVRTDGGMGGYRWGVERKQKLLERERGVD